MHDNNSLAHTSWNCKYHIVFAPKYRRKVFYGQNRVEVGKILRELCEWKGVHIIEAEVCPDHIHMFVEIPPKMSVSICIPPNLSTTQVNHNSTTKNYFIG